MTIKLSRLATFVAFFLFAGNTLSLAQDESQEQLFQQYQAMVIIEEVNQRCPILSRLEAEVLRGQIVFANDRFAGRMEPVEQFKREARIFARRVPCNAPEIVNLVGVARQQANDSMVNHMLLARQIHLFDEQDRRDGKIENGLLLTYLTDEEWQLIENLHDEVKDNYLSQASEEDWDKYMSSVEKMAEERKASEFLSNQAVLEQMGDSANFQTAQARASNFGITNYYRYLEKSVRAFIEGANADETGFPYSRPANDFTNWTSYRPRVDDLNWVVSYEGCGENIRSECTLFTNVNDEIGLVLPEAVKNAVIEYRNPENDDQYRSFNAVEGPIGSNLLHEDNMDTNIKTLIEADDAKRITAALSEAHDGYRAQVGSEPTPKTKVFMFPDGTLKEIEKLKKNDLLRLTVELENGPKTYVMPIHNYHRAKNWAYAAQ